VVVLGLDACKGRWLCVALEDGRFLSADLLAAAATATARADAEVIAVDIPIGLPESPSREADAAARAFVGVRRSTVFATFPAAVLDAVTYEEAKALCEAQGWPRPSFQSYGMRHRIREIAELAAADERIIEVHPEVSFRELIGHDVAPKRTATGVAERRRALAGQGIELPDLPFPEDDVLDATVAAWSGWRYANGEALPLPDPHPTRVGVIWR
jgi:predicted RNase H-like nuclease